MLLRSPYYSLEPYPRLHFSSMLEASVERWPNKVAFINGVTGETYTFQQVWRAANKVARLLQDRGLRKGDRVAIFAPNGPEYAVAFHGTLLAGAAATTLNPLYREREVEHQLNDSGAVALFAARALQPLVEDIRGQIPALREILLLEEVWSLADQVAGDPAPVPIQPEEQLAVLPYSSGTTGLPKGVMLTHFNLSSNLRQTLTTGLIDAYSVLLDFLPFYHIYGMMVLLNSGALIGATQVVLPRFDPELVLSLVEKYRVTNLFAVPPAMLALANVPEPHRYDTSSLRFILSGAAPLAPEVGRQVGELYGCLVTQGYGLTETSPVTNANPLTRVRLATVGPPISDTLERVVDLQSGQEVGPGEIGELLVKGPQVMKGYWNQPDATREAFTEDGWLRTGDIVAYDEDAYVTIHDRAKEMIKYKGYQVAPAELEAVLLEHPAVLDAAVIPKADPVAGEAPKAFVVLRQGQQATPEELMAFVAERVAPYKKVREVEYRDAIPKNPSGKILRRLLIEEERAKAGS